MATPAKKPTRRKPTVRNDKAIIAKRKNRAFELLCYGERATDVVLMIQKEFNVSERTAYIDYTAAREDFVAEMEAERPRQLAYHLAVRKIILRKAFEDNDLQMALRAADSQAKLEGLFVERVETTARRPLEDVPDDELGKSLVEFDEL